VQQRGQEGLAAGKAVSGGDFWPLDVAAAAATTFSRLNIIISITHQAVINDTQIVHECRLMMRHDYRDYGRHPTTVPSRSIKCWKAVMPTFYITT